MHLLSRILLGLVLVAAAAPSWASAAPRYYMVMFAAETPQNTARTSHTFATFVKQERGELTEELTVSWLPASGFFGPGYSMPPARIVPGRNYTLDETIRLSPGRRTSFWGPYEITPALYDRAARRVAFLDAARTAYKMTHVVRSQLREPALRNEPGGAINCIMAVSDIGGYLHTGTAWGIAASSQVLSFLAPGISDPLTPTVAHPEIAEAMDLYRRIGR